MAYVLDSLPRDGRVAVIRLRSLGDCVLTTPALAILKQARPDLRIAVAVEPRFAAVFEGNPDIDVILPPEAAAVRRFRPGLCLNLHGGNSSARMTVLSGARYRAGFAHYRHSFLYNVQIPRAQEILGVERKVHTAEHLASAMFFLGVPRCEIPRARLFAAPGGATSPYAVIHPFASEPGKAWPAERFISIARQLSVEPVFLAGPADDVAPFRDYRTVAGAPLAEVKSLIAGAALFIGNDSGPAHMAAAFGLPVVVLFGTSDPEIWYPWRTAAEVISGNPIESIAESRVLEALEQVHA